MAIASFDPINGYPPGMGTVLRWVPAVIVAVALIRRGVRPLSRLVVWVVALLALWVLSAVFTALSYGLGMRMLDGDLREMAQAAAQVFPVALEVEVLLVVGAVVGTVIRFVVEQTKRGETGEIALPTKMERL